MSRKMIDLCSVSDYNYTKRTKTIVIKQMVEV